MLHSPVIMVMDNLQTVFPLLGAIVYVPCDLTPSRAIAPPSEHPTGPRDILYLREGKYSCGAVAARIWGLL